MLDKDVIARIEDQAVREGCLKRSNEELWHRLRELEAENAVIKSAIPGAYELGHSGERDMLEWRSIWLHHLNAMNANIPVMRNIVWHLLKRGDLLIDDWVREHAEPFFSWHS